MMKSLKRYDERRLCTLFLLLAVVTLLPLTSHGETLSEREQRLRAMSKDDKEKLRRNSERFYGLSPGEQNRFRQLHDQIASHDKAQELHGILGRYSEWLKTLSSVERAKLLGMPVKDRIATIKQLQQKRERERFGFFGESQLPAEDIPKILRWTMAYIDNHEREIIGRLPQQRRQRILRAQPRERRRMLLTALMQRRPSPKDLSTSAEEIQRLAAQLSPEARAILDNARGEKKKILVARWISASILAKVFPKVSNDKLERFKRETLTEAWRERLDAGSADIRKRQLLWLYQYHERSGKLPAPRDYFIRPQQLDRRPVPSDRIEADRRRPD